MMTPLFTKRMPGGIAGSLVGLGALAPAGCASSMVPATTRDADSGITSVVRTSTESNDKAKDRQVDVQTRKGVVHLTGVVDTEATRVEAGKVAWRTQSVRGVVNELTVGERTVGSWIDDVMISSKVKSKLIANSEIKADDIDVSSLQSVVTLIERVAAAGRNTRRETVGRRGQRT